jgi:NAD(P)-dependent dehydrogenase (short-subunit alcohol dehydrogenase family)
MAAVSQTHRSSRPTDWGTGAIGNFIQKQHHDVYPALDASKAVLPKPYVVCIVGASRGIGRGVAFSYAKAGATGLVLASRRISGLEETAIMCKALNSEIEVEIVACDITVAPSVAGLAASAKAKFERLDAIIINSGYSGPVVLKVTEVDPMTFQNAINVNYIGTFHCAKYLIPLLLESENGAKVFIAVSSFASLLIRGVIANTQYCVSKAAQLKLMEHVHEQYVDEGLCSFSIHPGAVASEMADETTPDAFRPYLIDSPELCGAFAVWLTKDGKKRDWLCGRLVSANWDVEELEAKREKVVEQDLLKLTLIV